ncbi:uncharacterized protein METZ01_LOCUS146565 [marine metagenome]|uniref:Peptidase M14 domain-containing protein n=1 Tax=marine metagenome TaxID=408172 RepID=A0A381ZXK0_9ZZZZ
MTRVISLLPPSVLVLLTLGCGPTSSTDSGPSLWTRAERTRYEQTTGYGEVVQFLERAAASSERMHLTTFGQTTEGRPLPLMVVGEVPDARPSSVIAPERTRVWLQGNIHGGEVCGKEALLMLVRALARNEHPEWSASLVLLIAPIYNADGNEQIAFDNRPLQFGPFDGMGERTNAQGLDLNRDHTKLESPEARALVRAYQEYDPHVIVDLHTTNGTEHGYHLTYAPPLHPNTHPLIDGLLRDEWLPTVTTGIKASNGWELYYYGNVPRGSGTEPSWRTFDHRPRFNNNYAGLRNRIGILSEAYAYATFEERVNASRRFIEELLRIAHNQTAEIRSLVTSLDRESVVGTKLATRGEAQRSPTTTEILLGSTEELQHPYTQAPIRRRLDVAEPTTMYEYGRFSASEEEVAPATYYIPERLTSILELLAAHGVDGTALEADVTLAGERFAISRSTLADRQTEEHLERTIEGVWGPAEFQLPAGTVAIPVAQPLGRLAFTLLEPRSDDGFVNWNLLDDEIQPGGSFPILRVMSEPEQRAGQPQ